MNYENLVTVIDKQYCMSDIVVTFLDINGHKFNLLFNSYTNHDNLLDYINAAHLLKENIYYDQKTGDFLIKEWKWKFYTQGNAWYKVQ